MGKSAFRGEDNWPSTNSLFISNPTKKKKIAINPSFTQESNEYSKSMEAFLKPTCVLIKLFRLSKKPVFAKVKAKITQVNKTTPLPVFELTNFLKIFFSEFDDMYSKG